jgi:hypothetical protein
VMWHRKRNWLTVRRAAIRDVLGFGRDGQCHRTIFYGFAELSAGGTDRAVLTEGDPNATRPIEILNRADYFSECRLRPSCLRIIGLGRSHLQ